MTGQAGRAVQLESSWLSPLAGEFEQPYMADLKSFLQAEKRAGKRIFPPGSEFFSAFSHTPLDRVKVVILGQDPYHGEGQAHGLCFSVRPGVQVPPSLQNIYREIHDELGLPIPRHGHLTAWADRGVLLLNSVLSVECARAGSHRDRGWEIFTDRVIEVINREREAGVSRVQVLRQCATRRFRPIILTTLTTFFGLLPMIAEESLQARFLIPMAISLAFGVMFATCITLILVPSLYLVLEDIKSRVWSRV